jgi:predicted RNA-binding Zn ribbon-like protein
METDTPRELPIIGGNLALDFANTVDDPLGAGRHDHLDSYENLLRWSRRVGTIDARRAGKLRRHAEQHRPHATRALRRAHELRDVLNEVFGGIVDGATDVLADWERLRPFVADATANAVLEAGDILYTLKWPSTDDLNVVLHPVASAASGLLLGDELGRLKRCGLCPWLFVDRSRNHSRRWCDMNDCGTAVKMERYVTRRAAGRSMR